MAVPKKRHPHGRRNRRRRHNTVLKIPTLITCPSCGGPQRAHNVCTSCGNYRGRDYSAIMGIKKHT